MRIFGTSVSIPIPSEWAEAQPYLSKSAGSAVPSIRTANSPAFVAFWIATVATGTPLGICTGRINKWGNLNLVLPYILSNSSSQSNAISIYPSRVTRESPSCGVNECEIALPDKLILPINHEVRIQIKPKILIKALNKKTNYFSNDMKGIGKNLNDGEKRIQAISWWAFDRNSNNRQWSESCNHTWQHGRPANTQKVRPQLATPCLNPNNLLVHFLIGAQVT